MIKSHRYIMLFLIFLIFHVAADAQDDFKPIEKLSKGADVILSGKVMAKKSHWNDGKTRILTKTTVQVDEYLKGNGNGNSVEITTPGGEVDGVGEIYTHLPTFQDQEEVVVFLKVANKQQGFTVFRGEEGIIKVLNDEKAKQKVTSTNIPLETLKSQIKSFVTKM